MAPEFSCPEAGGIFLDEGLNPALTGGFLTSGPPGKFCIFFPPLIGASLIAQLVNNPPAMQETWV